MLLCHEGLEPAMKTCKKRGIRFIPCYCYWFIPMLLFWKMIEFVFHFMNIFLLSLLINLRTFWETENSFLPSKLRLCKNNISVTVGKKLRTSQGCIYGGAEGASALSEILKTVITYTILLKRWLIKRQY